MCRNSRILLYCWEKSNLMVGSLEISMTLWYDSGVTVRPRSGRLPQRLWIGEIYLWNRKKHFLYKHSDVR